MRLWWYQDCLVGDDEVCSNINVCLVGDHDVYGDITDTSSR